MSRPNLWEVVNLIQISLVSVRAATTLDAEHLPEAPPHLQMHWAATGRDLPDESRVEILAEMSVRASVGEAEEAEEAEEAGDPSDPLIVEARYRLLYERPNDYVPTAEEVEAFAGRNGVFNAWPYFRELSHGIYGKMNIPLPPVPVFRVAGQLHARHPK